MTPFPPRTTTSPTGAMMAARPLVVERRPLMGERPVPAPIPPARQASDAESSFELVLRAREGDERAIDELCSRYLPRLTRWAHGRLPAWTRGALETQDLVQDTLVQVVKRLRHFDPRHEGAFQAYARQALLNRIRDEIRKAQRRPFGDPLDSQRPGHEASPLEEAIGRETVERYEAALMRLKPEDREAVIARIEMGLPAKEIAAALGKPSAAAAHMAVSRALVRLAREMARGTRV
jgi:RNA polymerase sigma factor (sigma-70 family)